MSTTKLGVWHAMRRHWWYANDSNDAKGVTRCGIRRDHIDVYGHRPPVDDAWCSRCFPHGKPETVLIKTVDQLRRLTDLNREYLKQQMKRNAQTPLGLDAA